MELESKKEIPQEDLDYLADRSIPISERIAKARELAVEYGEIVVAFEKSGVADGVGFKDNIVTDEDILRVSEEYGFPENAYDKSFRV